MVLELVRRRLEEEGWRRALVRAVAVVLGHDVLGRFSSNIAACRC